MDTLLASFRLTVVTMAICVAGYTGAILGFAQALTPETAQGSLIEAPDGTVIGSRLIAQGFTAARYFRPRPSAVDYDAAAAGGSNQSPTSSDLTARARRSIALYAGLDADSASHRSATTANAARTGHALPADLAAASGSGLDPHISELAALYQAAHVARARGLTAQEVEQIVRQHAFAPGGFLTPQRLVNVLELNLALDAGQRAIPQKNAGDVAVAPRMPTD